MVIRHTCPNHLSYPLIIFSFIGSICKFCLNMSFLILSLLFFLRTSFPLRRFGIFVFVNVHVWQLYIVALECKPANSQGNFTGQRKNKQDLLLLLWKETIFHIFFLQLTIVILSSSFTWTMLSFFFRTVLISLNVSKVAVLFKMLTLVYK